jgi:hypothetical protein
MLTVPPPARPRPRNNLLSVPSPGPIWPIGAGAAPDMWKPRSLGPGSKTPLSV